MTSLVVSLENKSSNVVNTYDNVFLEFTKLVGSPTYHNWKIHVKSHHKRERVWDVVTPICIVIVGISSLTIRNITSCTNRVRTNPTRNSIGTFIVGMVINQDLVFRQIKDMSIIIAIIINKLFSKVTKFDDPKLTWEYVHTHYKMHDVLRWMYLCNRLQLLKIIKESGVETYLHWFKHIQIQFSTIGQNLESKD